MTDAKLPTIRAPKNSDLLARELRRRILDGALEPGMPLPAERDLMVQTGLSRGSVREALRILETESLVRTKPGRTGGSVVSRPDDQSMHRSMSLFVGGRGITLLSLLQTREAVEPSLAALAAQNRTASELKALVDVTQRVEDAFADVPLFLRENVAWHCAIADASHNELLRAFMLSISNLVYKASAIENFATGEVRRAVIRSHRQILGAITDKDAEAARRRMARNLAALTAACRKFPNAPLVIEI